MPGLQEYIDYDAEPETSMERVVADSLVAMLELPAEDYDEIGGAEPVIEAGVSHAEPYRHTGLLTNEEGLVLTMDDGTQFQITVQYTGNRRI